MTTRQQQDDLGEGVDEAVSPSELASRRCWARRPVGPGDVPAGKLRRAAATVSGVMSTQGGIWWLEMWLLWVEALEGIHCCWGLGAKPFRQQGGTGFAIPALTC